MTNGPQGKEQAIFAGGCFWCTEAVLKDIQGVDKVESGYIGGGVPNPTYRAVCYKDLLGLFMATHDPTSLNRQGADVGTQYRSAVFPLSAEQERQTREVFADLGAQNVFDRPIVTTVEPASEFYVAEDYHQDYFANNPRQPYCAAVIAPKVAKLRKYYGDRLKAHAQV